MLTPDDITTAGKYMNALMLIRREIKELEQTAGSFAVQVSVNGLNRRSFGSGSFHERTRIAYLNWVHQNERKYVEKLRQLGVDSSEIG